MGGGTEARHAPAQDEVFGVVVAELLTVGIAAVGSVSSSRSAAMTAVLGREPLRHPETDLIRVFFVVTFCSGFFCKYFLLLRPVKAEIKCKHSALQ